MDVLWRLLVEITVQPGDFAGGCTNGFINVITRASTAEHACRRLADYLRTFGWHIIEVDTIDQVENLTECSSEMEDMIDRAGNNPLAIILGTLHTYKVN